MRDVRTANCILQGFCLFVAALTILPFSVAFFDPAFGACGQKLDRTNCTSAKTIMMLNGTIFAVAIGLFVWLRQRIRQ